MSVYDLRGTHGSGKSHVVHTLIKRYGQAPILADGVIIGHYVPPLGLAVVGPYTKVCGGCDAVRTQDEVCHRVRAFSLLYPKVLLEGALVGHTFSRYAALADEIGDYTFMFLDTPLEECVRRVKARREAKGNTKPLDPKNIVRDHHTTQTKVRAKFTDAGYRVVGIPWEKSVEAVLAAMKTRAKPRVLR